MKSYRFRYNWNMKKILEREKAPTTGPFSYFLVKDLAVNSIYASGWELLG